MENNILAILTNVLNVVCVILYAHRLPNLTMKLNKMCNGRNLLEILSGVSITYAKDDTIRQNGTDGGGVTDVLTHLFDTGKINGAIVSKNTEHCRVDLPPKS